MKAILNQDNSATLITFTCNCGEEGFVFGSGVKQIQCPRCQALFAISNQLQVTMGGDSREPAAILITATTHPEIDYPEAIVPAYVRAWTAPGPDDIAPAPAEPYSPFAPERDPNAPPASEDDGDQLRALMDTGMSDGPRALPMQLLLEQEGPATHPGQLLGEVMAQHGVDRKELAEALHYMPATIDKVLSGEKDVDETLARRLEHYFQVVNGPTAAEWLIRQALWEAENPNPGDRLGEITPLHQAPQEPPADTQPGGPSENESGAESGTATEQTDPPQGEPAADETPPAGDESQSGS